MKEKFFYELNLEGVRGNIVLLDVDGTVVADGSNDVSSEAINNINELKNNNEVFFCSNKSVVNRAVLSERAGVPFLSCNHRKPSKKILREVENRDNKLFLVIGDKLFTDGWFAKKIGAQFIKVARIRARTDSFFVWLTYLFDDIINSVISCVGPYMMLARPSHWVKNLLIFAPIFFAKEILNYSALRESFFAFIVFCLAASSVYVLNDLVDVDADRNHEFKRNRPIASGRVGRWQASLFLFALLFVAGIIMLLFIKQIFWLLSIYLILNIIYSFFCKRIVVIDIVMISFFYLLRVMVGGAASGVYISRWLELCVIFASLLVIVGKRVAEARRVEYKREVLNLYSDTYLRQLLSVSAGLVIASYGLYSVLGVSSNYAVYSIFFVLIGVLRYLFLISNSVIAEQPEKIFYADKILTFSIICWAVYMYIIL